MTPRTAHALKLLRLNRLYSGCFLQLNTTTLNLLRVAQPYITWGLAPVFIDFNNSCFYRAMHFSAKRGIAIACRLSVCLSVRPSVRL